MPNTGTETRLTNALVAALGTIGTPPASWLTTPAAPVEGTPGDAVGPLMKPQIYVQFFRTDPTEGAGMTRHRARVQFMIWFVTTTFAQMHALKADVLRALFAAESSFTTSFGQPFWPDAYQFHPEMQVSGNQTGSLTVWIEVEIDHSSP